MFFYKFALLGSAFPFISGYVWPYYTILYTSYIYIYIYQLYKYIIMYNIYNYVYLYYNIYIYTYVYIYVYIYTSGISPVLYGLQKRTICRSCSESFPGSTEHHVLQGQQLNTVRIRMGNTGPGKQAPLARSISRTNGWVDSWMVLSC